MGLEWHERHRDKYGRFAALHPAAPVQIHIRLTERQADRVHAAALEARQSMRAYCTQAVLARMAAEGHTDAEAEAEAEA